MVLFGETVQDAVDVAGEVVVVLVVAEPLSLPPASR
jgi:hypothetical protein